MISSRLAVIGRRDAYSQQNEDREIRTPNLLIWSQARHTPLLASRDARIQSLEYSLRHGVMRMYRHSSEISVYFNISSFNNVARASCEGQLRGAGCDVGEGGEQPSPAQIATKRPRKIVRNFNHSNNFNQTLNIMFFLGGEWLK